MLKIITSVMCRFLFYTSCYALDKIIPYAIVVIGKKIEKIGKAGGKEADMILISGNPLKDILAFQDVLLVMSNEQVALRRIPFAEN